MQPDTTVYNIPRPFVIILLIISLFVISGGVILYKTQEKKTIYEKQNELEAIISLKVKDISRWRMEHIRDGNFIGNDNFLNDQISNYFNNENKTQTKQELIQWMQTFITNYDYQNIFILDNTRTLRLSFPLPDSISNSIIASTIGDTDFSKLDFTYLRTSDKYPGIFVDLVVPLISSDKINIGTMILRINPEITLFPMILSWPTPSRSSETLLLRRDGDSVLFLNELRHQKNTALKLRLPLSNRNLPASMAAMGLEGAFEGVDYRNIPVISVLKKVPDSPWFMVAKVDRKEIYSPLYELVALISTIAFLGILSITVMIGFYFKNQGVRFFKDQLDSELKRRKAEEDFRLLSLRNEAILAAVPNIIMEVDNNKIYRWSNKAGYEFFGNDVIGKEAAFYFEGKQDTYMVVDPLFYGDIDKTYIESWQRRIDGEIRLLAWWCKSLKDEKGKITGVLSSAYDVTQQKNYELELKKNQEQLRALNSTRDKIFSIISHDLKSPFNSILGFSELLLEKTQKKDMTGTEQYATIIHNSSVSAMDLLINLTEWSKLQTGRIEFHPREVDIVSIIDEVVELLDASALQKSIIIIKKIPSQIIVQADRVMINTILRNLITNSIKFSHTGGEIFISANHHSEDEVIIEIKDYGIGMKKEIVANLFSNEADKPATGTHNEQGTGLGLILCKEFVSNHGGKIWADSEEGKGSSFKFTLPFKIDKQS